MRAILNPHPETPGPGIAITVDVKRAGEGLALTYAVQGDLAAIRVPEPAEATGPDGWRADELWKHTCFEAFIGGVGTPGYIELNFAPSMQWAAYAFDNTRQGQRGAVVHTPSMSGCIPPRALQLSVEIAGVEPRDIGKGRPWRLGLCAVIEEIDGRLSYWALNHPSAKPDFHHPQSFVLDLP